MRDRSSSAVVARFSAAPSEAIIAISGPFAGGWGWLRPETRDRLMYGETPQAGCSGHKNPAAGSNGVCRDHGWPIRRRLHCSSWLGEAGVAHAVDRAQRSAKRGTIGAQRALAHCDVTSLIVGALESSGHDRKKTARPDARE